MLDREFGCPPDALFWIFSASKPFVALLVHLLAQRSELALDDHVAEHWPRFGRHGKESVTIRQVLRHRSGLPVAHGAARDALAMIDWDQRCARSSRPAFPRPPGRFPPTVSRSGWPCGRWAIDHDLGARRSSIRRFDHESKPP